MGLVNKEYHNPHQKASRGRGALGEQLGDNPNCYTGGPTEEISVIPQTALSVRWAWQL